MSQTAMQEVDSKGAFVRTESVYRNWVRADGSTNWQPEKDRYHLYIALACPWCCRVLMARNLKGLDKFISVSYTGSVFQKTRDDPGDEHYGWTFVLGDEPRATPDHVLGSNFVRDIYEREGTQKKFTVPILFDKKTNKIVSNESADIVNMFNSEFNAFSSRVDLDLRPADLVGKIDEVNPWVYHEINNGVYRAGFAKSQDAYDVAVADVFNGLDKVEALLSKTRYLAGDRFTEADLRLLPTLVRFDEVYHGHFKCNKKKLAEYPNIDHYVRDLCQIAGVAGTVDMGHIKRHYHRSHPTINVYGIVPVGPGVAFDGPHDRDARGPVDARLAP